MSKLSNSSRISMSGISVFLMFASIFVGNLKPTIAQETPMPKVGGEQANGKADRALALKTIEAEGGVVQIDSMGRVHSMLLNQRDISDNCLASVAMFTELESLDLEGGKLPEEAWSFLRTLSNLKLLSLNY